MTKHFNKKPKINKHFKEDDLLVKQDPCLTKGDPCESNTTCENGEICLNDSEEEGFCYPAFCADVLKVKYHTKAKGKKRHHGKSEKVYQDLDECFDKKYPCNTTGECFDNKICLHDNIYEGYCFPKYCVELINQ